MLDLNGRRRPGRVRPIAIVACAGLFAAMTIGTAYAAVGKNSVGPKQLQRNAVQGRHIEQNAIKGRHVEQEKLKGRHIKDNSLTGEDIAPDTIGTEQIFSRTILGRDIADTAIKGRHVLDDSLTGADIADSTLESEQIVSRSLLGADLADDTIGSRQVRDDSLTGADIDESTLKGFGGGGGAPSGPAGGDLDGTYPDPTIADGAVGTGKLSGLAVTSAKIAQNAIDTGKIADGAVTGPKIAADAIGSGKVADDSLTGDDVDESTLGKVGDADTLDGSDSGDFQPLIAAGCPAGGAVGGIGADGSLTCVSGVTPIPIQWDSEDASEDVFDDPILAIAGLELSGDCIDTFPKTGQVRATATSDDGAISVDGTSGVPSVDDGGDVNSDFSSVLETDFDFDTGDDVLLMPADDDGSISAITRHKGTLTYQNAGGDLVTMNYAMEGCRLLGHAQVTLAA